MNENALHMIRNLKKKALEKCEERIRDAKEKKREPMPAVGAQHGMTCILKHRHGL